MSEIDLYEIVHGTITAPAGCGKTQLIADALKRFQPTKPVLVLTHTNAGVAALRNRLRKAGVSPWSYRLYTIDGWALRLISTFPTRSNHRPEIIELAHPGTDYPNIREAAGSLVCGEHLNKILCATYSRLWVDEYQDCLVHQHTLITAVASVLPTCVLGDPMQAIFGFGGNRLVTWDDVHRTFPPAGELRTPWRWKNAGTEKLGDWIMQTRNNLISGAGIDLRKVPCEVTWVQLKPDTVHRQRAGAAGIRPSLPSSKVIVIGDSTSPRGQREIASQTPGATAVESVSLDDLTNFGRSFDLSASDSLEKLINFASITMTNVGGPVLLKRISVLQRGKARTSPTEPEIAALNFISNPTYLLASRVLVKISEAANVRRYRPELLRFCIHALRLAHDGNLTFIDATKRARETYRHTGRSLSKRAVGSTLLLKGLESDVVVILNPEVMDAKHLYVSLTRASKQIVICSINPILQPLRPI